MVPIVVRDKENIMNSLGKGDTVVHKKLDETSSLN